MERIIDRKYLTEHRNEIFVFGDNTVRIGKGGAAALRDEPNTWGFVTKIFPDNNSGSFYTPETYPPVYKLEMNILREKLRILSDQIFLVSKLGAGLANRFGIFEKVIEPRIKEDLKNYKNVEFLW